MLREKKEIRGMKMNSRVMRHKEICKMLNKIYEAKNSDYGNSFGKSINEWGMAAAGVRMSDKLNRFTMLTKNEASVKDESIKDTLLDLANYAIMTYMEVDFQEQRKARMTTPTEVVEEAQ